MAFREDRGINDPGWLGTVINFIVNLYGALAPILALAGLGLIYWDIRRHRKQGATTHSTPATNVFFPPNTPLAIANHFLATFGGSGIDHMKLQKLVYFAHGWWLATHDSGAIALVNERPQVWKHGPVFDSLYRVLKPFGSSPIVTPQASSPFDHPPLVDRDDGQVIQLLGWVWQRYGHLSSFALSDLTHRPGTAWRRIAEDYKFIVPMNLEIPDEYIREEFLSLLRREAVSTVGVNGDHRQQVFGNKGF